jgi:hypothetical protein
LQVDVISYENITSDSPVWPALMGINAQLASISRSTALVLGTLKKGASGQQQQQQQPVRMAREILPTPGTSLGGASSAAQPLQVSQTTKTKHSISNQSATCQVVSTERCYQCSDTNFEIVWAPNRRATLQRLGADDHTLTPSLSAFAVLQETGSVSGIQDAIYKVLSTQAVDTHISCSKLYFSHLRFPCLQETGSISSIQDAIYKVLSTQALYNGTELVTSRHLVRSVIHEVALSNGLITVDTNSSSSSGGKLSDLNETDVKILLDIVATVGAKCMIMLCFCRGKSVVSLCLVWSRVHEVALSNGSLLPMQTAAAAAAASCLT